MSPIGAQATAKQNIGRKGADISPGDLVVRRGDLLNPSRLGAVAAIGCARVEVFAKPRVAILSTGNEVVAPGTPLSPGQIYDVNRFTLTAVAEAHGGVAEMHTPARDTLEALNEALDACAGCRRHHLLRRQFGRRSRSAGRPDRAARRDDLSRHRREAGKADHVRDCGRSALLRHAGQSDLVPVERLHPAGAVPASHRAPARSTHRAHSPRRSDAASSRRQVGTSSTPCASHGTVAFPAFKGSGDITSLSQADGYIEIPASEHTVEEGTRGRRHAVLSPGAPEGSRLHQTDVQSR